MAGIAAPSPAGGKDAASEMTWAPSQPHTSPLGSSGRTPVRLPERLWVSAAGRLVGDQGSALAREAAARRFVRNAAGHGIDMSLCWGTIEDGRRAARVREVCLAVPSAGRAAMLFLSGPGVTGDDKASQAERVAVLNACLDGLEGAAPGRAKVAQLLPEPAEDWVGPAATAAGMTYVGDLAYLRKSLRGAAGAAEETVEVTGALASADRAGRRLRISTVAELSREGASDLDTLLVRALDATYEGTLDCPALCGMRDTRDVLESHRAVGRYDPSGWVVVLAGDEPVGCCLLAHLSEVQSVELVYFGLAPAVRGLGLGAALLERASRYAGASGARWLSCAVDRSNEPAARLYRRAGFSEFSARRAFVASLGDRGGREAGSSPGAG